MLRVSTRQIRSAINSYVSILRARYGLELPVRRVDKKAKSNAAHCSNGTCIFVAAVAELRFEHIAPPHSECRSPVVSASPSNAAGTFRVRDWDAGDRIVC